MTSELFCQKRPIAERDHVECGFLSAKSQGLACCDFEYGWGYM